MAQVEISDERLAMLNINREDYNRIKGVAYAREEHVPNVGDTAPAFNLERLTAAGEQTGEFVALESLRGKPVVLYFGSFT